jgi:predicted enzyme related to lactoylglutathione lyase
MATRYAHTNLIAHDWERLAAFYIRVFECERVEPRRDQKGEWLDRGSGVKNAHIRGQHLRLPGFAGAGPAPTLEIYQYDEVLQQTLPVANRAGFGHLAFAVDDVEATPRAVVDAGGSSHGSVAKTTVHGVGELTFTYVRDPEGNLIELQSWDP